MLIFVYSKTMAAKFEYDDSGDTFLYFIMAVLGLILLPSTYYVLWPKKEEKRNENTVIAAENCMCEDCKDKRECLRKVDKSGRWLNYLYYVLLIMGWSFFFFLTYKVATADRTYVEWDPYSVLGIDNGASMAEIKKAYRRLSMKMHPDRGGDEAEFVKLTKAYQALTDDTARENWEKYGNPDGPGATTFWNSIALMDCRQKVFDLGSPCLYSYLHGSIAGGSWFLVVQIPQIFNAGNST